MLRPVLALILVATPAVAQDAKGTRYAFLVGCSGYDATQLRPLPHAIDDVTGFRDALLETGFEADNVKLLHDKHPERRYLSERAKIVKELRLLVERVGPNDTLVVAVSGHGVHFKGDAGGYFCPVDADLGDKTSLIALEGAGGLYEILKGCKARQKLLLVNACRNDPAQDLAQAARQVTLDDAEAGEAPEGVAALFSCKAGQKSYYDPERKRGIFFDHLIRAWNGEYTKRDESLTLEMVFDQVTARTKADADKSFGRTQVPTVRREYQGRWDVRGRPGDGTRPRRVVWASMGLTVASLATEPGAVVLEVRPNSDADKKGIRPGDWITEVDIDGVGKRKIEAAKDVAWVIETHPDDVCGMVTKRFAAPDLSVRFSRTHTFPLPKRRTSTKDDRP